MRTYFVAAVATAAAVAARWAMPPGLAERSPRATIFAAVAISVWYGGWKPAAAAALVGYFAWDYLFVPPRFDIDLSSVTDFADLAVYLFVCTIIILLGERMRRSERRAAETAVAAETRGREAEREAEQRKRAERLLLSSMESSSDAITRIDSEWKYVYVNPAQERIGQKPRGELLGRSIWDVWPQARGTPLEAELRRAMSERVRVDLENHWVPWDRWYRIRISPTDDGGLVVFSTDISDRKEREKALRESEARERNRAEELEAVLAKTPTPIWIARDSACSRIEGNPAANELLGVNPGTNVSRSAPQGKEAAAYRVFRDGHEVPAEMLPMQRAAREAADVRGEECELRFPGGRTLHLLMSASPLRDGGRVRGVIAGAVDITERKQHEAELREREVRLAAILEQIPVGVGVSDAQGNWTVTNAAMREFVAERIPSRDPVRARRWRAYDERGELLLPDRWPGARALHGETVVPGVQFEFERGDGSVVHTLVSAAPLRDAAGKIAGAISVVQDVSAIVRAAAEIDRLRAELAARVQELQAILDMAPVQIWVGDAECKAFYGNRTAYEEHGLEYGVNASFDAPVRELPEGLRLEVDGRALEPHEMPMQIAARTGKPVRRFEHVVVHPDGRRRTMWADVAPLFRDDGRVRGVVGVYVDVTARLESDRALREAESRMRAFLENSAVIAWMKDEDGRYVFLSPNYERRFGVRLADWRGRTDFELWPAETAAQFRENDLAVLASEASVEVVEEARHADGSRSWWRNSKFTFRDTAGRRHVGGLGVELTAQVLAERAESARRHEMETLVREAPAAIWVAHDPQCRSVTGNPAAAEMMNVPPAVNMSMSAPADEVPRHVDIYREGRLLAPEELPMQTAARTGAVVREQELEFRFPDAPSKWAYGNAVPLFDSEGRVRGAIGTFVEITELKRAAEELREVARRKNEFIAMLAHELRNPLAPIKNSLTLLQLKGPVDRELVEARDVIDRQARQLSRLLDDLLDVNRLGRQKLELAKERVSLASVVASALETARPGIEKGRHRVTIDVPEDVVLDADPVRLSQVFANLLNNAAKYMNDGGEISVAAVRDGDAVVVSVKDTGIGIAPDALPRLFEMFSQVPLALERSQGGVGIGLSLAKGLVELHGGTIEARSDGAGKGSEFVVRLPVVVGAPAPAAAKPPRAPRKGGVMRRILIADDLRDNADTLAMMLRALGHQVHVAYDGAEAVACAERLRPEVTLLDIGMPGMNGYDACSRIREQPWGKSMYLIAQTGWGQEEDRRRAAEAGFDRHMLKPVDCAALVVVLANLPDRSAQA